MHPNSITRNETGRNATKGGGGRWKHGDTMNRRKGLVYGRVLPYHLSVVLLKFSLWGKERCCRVQVGKRSTGNWTELQLTGDSIIGEGKRRRRWETARCCLLRCSLLKSYGANENENDALISKNNEKVSRSTKSTLHYLVRDGIDAFAPRSIAVGDQGQKLRAAR